MTDKQLQHCFSDQEHSPWEPAMLVKKSWNLQTTEIKDLIIFPSLFTPLCVKAVCLFICGINIVMKHDLKFHKQCNEERNETQD